MGLIPEPELLLPSLSMTERRVGSFVAAGYSDTEIAKRLLVSAQIVEWSVAKLCRTLDVGSRDDLAAQLRALSGS
ncbi:MAG: LuxR C-terminal-related transcriptional regulator [Gaiellaceae bacterium]